MRKELQSFDSHKGIVRVGQVIQVKTGDYRRQFMDAEVVGLWQVEHVDEDGEKFFETDMSVRFLEDGLNQYVANIDGWNRNEWRIERE
jgi:hypothetical protein